MEKDTLAKRLMATFLEELDEHVRALNRDLLDLEKSSESAVRADRLKTLFRTAHSMKGAARSVGVRLIESACHALEDILSAARDSRLSLTPDLFALLFLTGDKIEEAGVRLRTHGELGGSPLADLLPRLEAAAAAVLPMTGQASFVKLPVPDESSLPAVAKPEVVPDPSGLAAGESTVSSVVRVAAKKLDDLLAQNGELLVARRRVQSRTEELVGIHALVNRWKSEWRSIEQSLGRQRFQGTRTKAREHDVERGFSKRAVHVLRQTGDRLHQLERDLDRLTADFAGDSRLLDQTATALDDEVRRVRMLPFAEACQGLERMVRDLAQAGGKDVVLVCEGGQVHLDRSVLEGLKDPLRHLIRNAIDHGVETPEERMRAGKPAQARITVAAALRGAHIAVTVADDGRGLDLEALRHQVRKRGLAEPADERALAQLIFLPEFSTARIITDVSGRGVGLDVVKSRLEALHGSVDLDWTAGAGTRFTLAVPLTLTTLRVILVKAGDQTYGFASTNVQKLVRFDRAGLRSIEGREMLSLGGPPLPVDSLADILGLPRLESAQPGGKALAVIVAAGEKRLAVVVDEFLVEQEIMLKNLGGRIRRVRHFSGATILPSGKIALVLNTADLVRTALARPSSRSLDVTMGAVQAKARKRILVADDSITTRSLEKSILEAAGYEVAVAPDGAAAWQMLQERGADLLVSDVEMPRMDGFALTEMVRSSKQFRELPVVLVTARDTDQDKARGIAVGADAYLGKNAFDQKNLLQAVAQLL